MKYLILTVCVITALVSSKGDVVAVNNVDNIVEFNNTVYIYQYYNPYVIKSDWTLKQVEDSITYAIKLDCQQI